MKLLAAPIALLLATFAIFWWAVPASIGRLGREIDALEEKLSAKLAALEDDFNRRLDAVDQNVSAKIQAVESSFNTRNYRLDARLGGGLEAPIVALSLGDVTCQRTLPEPSRNQAKIEITALH